MVAMTWTGSWPWRIRMPRYLRLGILVGTTACMGWLATAAQDAPDGRVKAVLALSQRFYYAGDPLRVRISIGNEGTQPVANPVKTPLFRGFQVRSGGKAIEAQGEPDVAEPARPEKLSPNAFYGSVVDLTKIYPQLLQPGEYEIEWSGGDVRSDTLVVRLIPRYDPAKDYTARLETDEGTIVLAFLKDAAPLAVKNFIDLAHAHFYDGLIFHEVRPDWYVAGGDPLGTGAGGAGYSYPAETPALPVVAGTVLMKPVSPSPPSNSSQFILMLRPEPTWTGQFTVFAQVIDGLEVAKRISRLPSTQQTAQPFFKPLKDVHLRRVVVEEKSAPGKAPAP